MLYAAALDAIRRGLGLPARGNTPDPQVPVEQGLAAARMAINILGAVPSRSATKAEPASIPPPAPPRPWESEEPATAAQAAQQPLLADPTTEPGAFDVELEVDAF